MSNTKISELPVYTGDTAGVYLVMDSADLSTTYKVQKENIVKVSGETNKFAVFNASDSVSATNYLYNTNFGNTLGVGTDAYNQGQPERMIVDGGGSWNIATFQTSATNSYAEVNIKNFGGGANASTDLVLWNDQTTENSGYLDIGINSSVYTGGQGGYAGDAYVVNTASDLYLGATITGSHGHVHIFGGGHFDDSQISVFSDKTIGFNTRSSPSDFTIPASGSGYVYEFSGNVMLDNDLKVSGSLIFSDNSSQTSAAISKAQLKQIVANSTDFNDFKSRIAAL